MGFNVAGDYSNHPSQSQISHEKTTLSRIMFMAAARIQLCPHGEKMQQ